MLFLGFFLSYVQSILLLSSLTHPPSQCTSLLSELFEKMFDHDPPQMTSEGLLNGFQPAFECAADLAMDFPRIYDVFGELLARCLAKEHINFQLLKGALVPLKSVDKAGVVMCAVSTTILSYLKSDLERVKKNCFMT